MPISSIDMGITPTSTTPRVDACADVIPSVLPANDVGAMVIISSLPVRDPIRLIKNSALLSDVFCSAIGSNIAVEDENTTLDSRCVPSWATNRKLETASAGMGPNSVAISATKLASASDGRTPVVSLKDNNMSTK